MDGNERLTWNSGVTGTDGLSPLSSSGVHSGSSQSSQAGGIPPYNNHPQGNWALTQNSSYTYSTLGQSQPGLMQSSYSVRQQLYSPPGNAYGNRSSQSPATGDGLVAPPYDNVGPTFPSAVAGGGSGHSSMLSQSSHHTPMPNSILSSQTTTPKRQLQQLRQLRTRILDRRQHLGITRHHHPRHINLRTHLTRIPTIPPRSRPPQPQELSRGEFQHSARIILCMRRLIIPVVIMEDTPR
ncbi:uncharacterized protein PG986_008063 [Apiospora aurea]|uniref:Uncharacterized protein n=1 Tax=Apiospora aurea TaxID=335848 RepID=A0ABR1QFS7_9PEZI